MDFLARRGQSFNESFDFKSADGSPISLPPGHYLVTLVHGNDAREYTLENGGLERDVSSLRWKIKASEATDFAYNTMYYTLYLNNTELSRGIVRVQ